MCPYVEHSNKGLWARVFASSAIVSVSDGVWGGGQRHSDKLHESRIFSEINLFTHESTSDESLRNSLLLGRAQPTQQPKLQQLIKMVIYSDGLGLRHTHTHHIIWPPDAQSTTLDCGPETNCWWYQFAVRSSRAVFTFPLLFAHIIDNYDAFQISFIITLG